MGHKLTAFTDVQIQQGIRKVVGNNPAYTPSTRVLRNVGTTLADNRESTLDVDELIRSAVRGATQCLKLTSDQFDLYVKVAAEIVEHLSVPKAARERYDAKRATRPRLQMSPIATV